LRGNSSPSLPRQAQPTAPRFRPSVTRLLQQSLFEVNAADPTIYLTLALLLLIVAEGACWFPARRATRIDPMVAMRAG